MHLCHPLNGRRLAEWPECRKRLPRGRRCEDPRNGVIIADFAVQGTLARQLLDSPSHVITRAGAKARKPYSGLAILSGRITRAGAKVRKLRVGNPEWENHARRRQGAHTQGWQP